MANKVLGSTRGRSSTCEMDDGDEWCILCRERDRYTCHRMETRDICKIHLIEAKQHHGTPGFVPKSIGQHGPSTTAGHYTQCVQLITYAFVSIENSKVMLGKEASTTTPFLL